MDHDTVILRTNHHRLRKRPWSLLDSPIAAATNGKLDHTGKSPGGNSLPMASSRATYLPQSNDPRNSYLDIGQSKFALQPLSPGGSQWFIPVPLSIPGSKRTRLRILLPNVVHPYRASVRRFGRRTSTFLWFFVLLFLVFAFRKPLRLLVLGKPSTLIFPFEDLRTIWNWEVENGHYPSHRSIPNQLGFHTRPRNPGIPFQRDERVFGSHIDTTLGTGPERTYPDIKIPLDAAYPTRPTAGSVADLDIIMEHCDPWEDKKYVRDCLELLRVGGGLDNGNRLRRGKLDEYKYIYREKAAENGAQVNDRETDPDPSLKLRDTSFQPPEKNQPRSSSNHSDPCDPTNPRIFHMFWAGPFTDKPYMALLSFLFTQNTSLHLRAPSPAVCRPQIWIWINPGPAASVPNPSAVPDMQAELQGNPWASPFLHSRFRDVIRFKLWNTTEQLNAIPELRDERVTKNLFKSEGKIIAMPAENNAPSKKTKDEDLLSRVGSTSSKTYDRLSVILSDMARFILCHRYGGTYIDADTLFLRDWEELWGWKGAFAYRWSWKKEYNTAVLHMNKDSALGTFLFRTAIANGLDFHPETISRYTKDAYLEGLLLRLPDALFDSPWLNTDKYQRERPPQPYFKAFSEFFDTPVDESAAPQALGFDGFFKGAYSYHYHNFWWKPFDSTRNWPDLGSRFAESERIARAALKSDDDDRRERIDDGDLSWANVMKRTFEAYIRGERPNMYGEWLEW